MKTIEDIAIGYAKQHPDATIVDAVLYGFSVRLDKKSKDTMDIRMHDFKASVSQYSTDYPTQMLKEFFDYWSEPNRSGTKMRWELEKTFDVGRRLARWANNSRNYGNNTGKPRSAGPTLFDQARRIFDKG